VEAINDLDRHELRLWMNLYLPSVKLVKKVRVGSKVRRVYDEAQTPLERVLAGVQAKPERVAELKKLHQSLDPFQLGKLIDQKLQRIYDLANRRLSAKVTAENRAAQAKEKTLRGRRNGCRKAARVESQKNDFSTELGNRAKNARFPLSNSRGHGGSPVTFPMSRRLNPGLHL
jgi:hypothetical protein